MAEFYDSNPIVVDNGTGIIKAGFAGEDAPYAVFPNVVAVEPGHANSNCRTRYIGDEAVTKKNLKWEYPMEYGVVADWDVMESVWHHMFYNELRVAPEEHTVLLTEPILNPKANREKMTQILFETYNVRGMYVALAPILSLHASGKKTGVVVDCGEGVTQVAPIEGGSIVYRAITRLKFSGSDITTEMGKLLNERGYAFSGSTVDLETVRTIKEKLAYVALDYENETGSVKPYELPDGQVITLETERYRCPEILFQPYLFQNYDVGIHQATYESISNCKANLQKELYENIVLSGGSTMFPGIAERMTKEIKNLAPRGTRVKVSAPPERKYSAWIGGSITASLRIFQEEWISIADYDEHGPSIVHHKCV